MTGLDLDYDAYQRLVLTTPDGGRHVGVNPVRAFPFSAPETCISFCDAAGREVYFLPETTGLTSGVRELLEAELSRREFIPVIHRIESVSPGAEPTAWHVLTDRGAARFELSNEDSIRRLGDHGALITDSHGVRFRILDLNQLDPHSVRILRRYL